MVSGILNGYFNFWNLDTKTLMFFKTSFCVSSICFTSSITSVYDHSVGPVLRSLVAGVSPMFFWERVHPNSDQRLILVFGTSFTVLNALTLISYNGNRQTDGSIYIFYKYMVYIVSIYSTHIKTHTQHTYVIYTQSTHGRTRDRLADRQMDVIAHTPWILYILYIQSIHTEFNT